MHVELFRAGPGQSAEATYIRGVNPDLQPSTTGMLDDVGAGFDEKCAWHGTAGGGEDAIEARIVNTLQTLQKHLAELEVVLPPKEEVPAPAGGVPRSRFKRPDQLLYG